MRAGILIAAVVSTAVVGGALADQGATAIIAAPIGDALVVAGDDGKDHVEYDVLLTNVFDAPVTLQSVRITDPAGSVLATLEGDALAAGLQTLLTAAPLRAIPASGSAALEVDLVLEPGKAPVALRHIIAYTIPEGDHVAPLLGGRTVEGPEVAVSARKPMTILAPLAGPGWASLNGCCVPNIHRSLRVGATDRIAKPELFAVDWVQVTDGKIFTGGDGSVNEHYPYFGAEVRSVAPGEVLGLHDGMAEDTPGQPVTTVKAPGDYGGNYLMIRIGPDVYAFYAHLQPGSLRVKLGDTVTAGEPLGKLGNTGNSTAPHLHFGLLDRPDFLLGTALPFVIEDFTVTGTVTGGDATGLQVEPVNRHVGSGYPLYGNLADFR